MSRFPFPKPARRLRVVALVLVLGCAAARAGPSDPRAEVAQALDDLVVAVSSCRFALATDPGALRALADRRLRPMLDVLFAGQLILGRWWSEASPDQRRRFAEDLYGSLVNRYVPGLLLLTDDTVTVPQAPAPLPGATEAVVPIVVRAPGSAPVPVELHLRRTGAGWRIFDARFEDLSPVFQLRQLYADLIREQGLARVLDTLSREAVAPAPAGGAACLAKVRGS